MLHTKKQFFLTIFLLISFISFFPSAFACDPQEDRDCCTADADCTVWINPALCTILPMNKVSAEKLNKENPTISGACKEESVKKLHETAKTYTPICVSHGCEFKVPGE